MLSGPVDLWRLLEASGGFWRLLEAYGGFWRLLEASPGLGSWGFWRLLEASGGFWTLLEASEAKIIEKALEFKAKLRFRVSRNAVVAPEMLGKQTQKSVPTATLLENNKMSIIALFF